MISFSSLPFRSTVKIIPSQLERKPKNAIQDKSPPEKDWELVPPDGGWGWLILAGAFNSFSIRPGVRLCSRFIWFQVRCLLIFWFRVRSRAVVFSSLNSQKRSMHRPRLPHGFHRYATFYTVHSVISLCVFSIEN